MSITVVIPAYNAAAFLHVALESVLNQTVAVDEILVVDDGSKDNTAEIAAAYGDRVRLLTQRNQGPSVARNLGIQLSSSDYLAFLDADDAWTPEKIARQKETLKANPKAILCYTGLLNLNTDGSRQISHASPAEEIQAALRLGNPGITPSCVLVQRAACVQAGGFATTLKGSEDWDFWLKLIQIGPFCAVDEPLTLYQRSVTGLSANAEWMFDEACSMLDDRLLAGLNGASRWLWRRRILSHQAYRAAMTARASGQDGVELSFLLRSFSFYPSPLWTPQRFKALAVTLKNRFV